MALSVGGADAYPGSAPPLGGAEALPGGDCEDWGAALGALDCCDGMLGTERCDEDCNGARVDLSTD